MNACRIKWVCSATNTQETCTLFVCLCAQFVNVQQLLACGKLAVLFAVGNNVLCNGRIDTGNVRQKWCASGVQVNTNLVYAVFYNAFQGKSQLLLVHVVLILSNTNGLWINLYKFSKWVLQTACNACRATLSNVKIGELNCCKFTCGVN